MMVVVVVPFVTYGCYVHFVVRSVSALSLVVVAAAVQSGVVAFAEDRALMEGMGRMAQIVASIVQVDYAGVNRRGNDTMSCNNLLRLPMLPDC